MFISLILYSSGLYDFLIIFFDSPPPPPPLSLSVMSVSTVSKLNIYWYSGATPGCLLRGGKMLCCMLRQPWKRSRGGGGVGGGLRHFFRTENVCRKIIMEVGVLSSSSSSMYMTDLWADKQRRKEKGNHGGRGGGGGGGNCPLAPPPPLAPPLLIFVLCRNWSNYDRWVILLHVFTLSNECFRSENLVNDKIQMEKFPDMHLKNNYFFMTTGPHLIIFSFSKW